MSATRRRLATRAWSQHPDPEWWRESLTRAHQSRFLRGAKGWAISFNWWVSKDNALQIREGVHDNKTGEFPKAEDRARETIRATRGVCRHEPGCVDQEQHLDRIVDQVLGIDIN